MEKLNDHLQGGGLGVTSRQTCSRRSSAAGLHLGPHGGLKRTLEPHRTEKVAAPPIITGIQRRTRGRSATCRPG